MADMTDPTWTTPWFWPGPLTPIGVMAKILDGKEDADNPNSMKPAKLKNKLDPDDTADTSDSSDTKTKTDSEECADEEAG